LDIIVKTAELSFLLLEVTDQCLLRNI